MKKQFNFVYLTTNLVSGKQYVGDHSTDNLDDQYLGSGVYIRHAIRNSSKDNFKREIIQFFDTKEEAFISQEKYIKEYDTLFPNGYNVNYRGGSVPVNCLLSTKEKISESMKGKNVGKTTWMKGRKHSNKSKEKMKINHKSSGMLNKHHTIEAKQKISKNSRSKDPIIRKKMSESHKGISPIRDNTIYSNIIADVNNRKICCPHCKKEFNPGNYGRYHGNKCKFKSI